MSEDGKEMTYLFTENGFKSFILKDFAGNQKIVAIEITNIDRENPEIDFSNVEDKWYNTSENVEVIFRDNIGLSYAILPDGKTQNLFEEKLTHTHLMLAMVSLPTRFMIWREMKQ